MGFFFLLPCVHCVPNLIPDCQQTSNSDAVSQNVSDMDFAARRFFFAAELLQKTVFRGFELRQNSLFIDELLDQVVDPLGPNQ